MVDEKQEEAPEEKTPEELEAERQERIEDAPDSGAAAQEALEAEVEDSEGRLGGDSGSQPGSASDRAEQDRDSQGGAGDPEGSLPTPSTR